MRRPIALLAVLGVLATAVLVLVGPAGAGSNDRPTIGLLEQPAWSALGTDVPLRLAVDGPTTGLEVRAVVHAFVSSRIAFERTLAGERLGSVIATTSVAADALPTALGGGRVLTLPLQDPALPRDPSRLRLPLPRGVSAGVYPVQVELRDPETGDQVASFVTPLVTLSPQTGATPIAEPLLVSWIWRIAADPATRPDGQLTRAFLGEIGPNGRLARIVSALPQAADVPLTLAPGPETLATWAGLAAGDPAAASAVNALRAAGQVHQVLSDTFVPVDWPSLERAGLGGEAANELAAGTSTLDAQLRTRVDPRTSYASPLEAATLERLGQAGVDRLVVEPSDLAPAVSADQFTPARPFALESGGRRFAAVQTSEELEQLLSGDAPPALLAQRFLAALVVVALEQPGEARGVTVDTPPRWSPSRALLDAVLSGLRGHPLLTAAKLDDQFNTVRPDQDGSGAPIVRQLAPTQPEPAAVSAAAYGLERSRLTGLASMVGADDPSVVRGERALLVSLTSAWAGASGRRRSGAQLASIESSVRAVSDSVSAPPTRTVTLTSRRAKIPVSLENGSGARVRVRVRLESEKLRFPDGNEQLLTLPPRNTTTRFDVEAQASGTFPLRVLVSSADGTIDLQQARYTVRSSVVSGVGVILTIGAGLFLAVWWVTHWRRSRRRPVPATSLAT